MIVNVYVLSEEDCMIVCDINRNYPRGPQIIICDYGLGCCVDETTINDPTYMEWRDALDRLEPFSSRVLQQVEIIVY